MIALVFVPLHARLLRRLGGRASLGALLTLAGAVVTVIVPFTLVSAMLAREAQGLYARLQSGEWTPMLPLHALFDALPGSWKGLLSRFGLGNFAGLQQGLTRALGAGTQFVATQALGIGQNTLEFLADLALTTDVAFFCIRDGGALLRPLLVGRDTRLPDVVIMVTTLGSMAVFGLNGFVIGPVIAALFVAVWHLHARAAAG